MLWLLLLIVDELPPVVLPMVGQDVREIEPQPPPPAPRAVDTVTALSLIHISEPTRPY